MTVPVHGLPPLLHEGMEVALVPPLLKRDRWHTVHSASAEGGAGQLVALSGCRSIGAAQELVGSTILARVDDLPADYLLHDVESLLGREVEDETHGTLGTIIEVMTGAANDVWVIEGPFGEVLVPVVDEFVLACDDHGPIRVRVPDGTVPGGGA